MHQRRVRGFRAGPTRGDCQSAHRNSGPHGPRNGAMNQAALAHWFATQDRQTPKQAIENEKSPIEMAKGMIRDGLPQHRRTSASFPRASSSPPGRLFAIPEAQSGRESLKTANTSFYNLL